MHVRFVDPSVLTFSLSLHRHPRICIPFIPFTYRFIYWTVTSHSESDREEWWGRNLDDFSRQALEDQKLNDDAISSRLTQRALPADGTYALSGPQCPQCTPVAAAGTPVCLLYLYNACLCPYLHLHLHLDLYLLLGRCCGQC